MNNDFDDLAYNPGESDFKKELLSIGLQNAVCAQIHNLGYHPFNGRIPNNPKLAMIFETGEKYTEGDLAGKPKVITITFAYWLGEGSNLREFLQAWIGQPIPEERIKGMNMRAWIGRPATLLINHVAKKQKVGMKAVIAGIQPYNPANPKLGVTYTETPEWVTQDKAKSVNPNGKPHQEPEWIAGAGQQQAAPSGRPSAPPPPEDDLPF